MWLTGDDNIDPYGESDDDIKNPYRFTGRRYDEETGLYYYRARYYNPEIGRFLSPDPIGYVDGMNMYSYVGNNPTRFIDPMGLSSLPNKKEHTRFIFIPQLRSEALLKIGYNDGESSTFRIEQADDIIHTLIDAKITNRKITSFKYYGHGGSHGGGIVMDKNGEASGIFIHSWDDKIYGLDTPGLSNLLKSVFVNDVLIELHACYSAQSNKSIAPYLKGMFPDASVFGYTGPAMIDTLWGTAHPKDNVSEYVEVKGGKSCPK